MTLRTLAFSNLLVAITSPILQAGTLQVCVKDPSGATVPAAAVVAYARATQQRAAIPTDAAGCARFENLPRANYELTIEANSFATEHVQMSYDPTNDQCCPRQV